AATRIARSVFSGFPNAPPRNRHAGRAVHRPVILCHRDSSTASTRCKRVPRLTCFARSLKVIGMGMLVDGKWHDVWYDTKASQGRFARSESRFRNWLTQDGSPGPSGKGGFKAEPGRYHLYVSWACPWAHRALIMRKLKGLEPMIGVSAVNSYMGSEGWTFEPGPGVIPDDVNGVMRIYQLYLLADSNYSGRATVPVLWDKAQKTIVSNESAEIMRMLNTAFDDAGANDLDF